MKNKIAVFTVLCLSIFALCSEMNKFQAEQKENERPDVEYNEYGEPVWDMYERSEAELLEAYGEPFGYAKGQEEEEQRIVDLSITYENKTHDEYDLVKKVDNAYEKITTYDTYEEASEAFDEAVLKDPTVMIMNEGGIAKAGTSYFVDLTVKKNNVATIDVFSDEACTKKHTYLSTSGSYGADAAYLGTSSNGNAYKIKIAGFVGWVKKGDAALRDFDHYFNSAYKVTGDRIKHYISTDCTSYTAASTVDVGENTIGLEKDTNYFSYDGNYFYKDFSLMIQDYQNGTTEHANNAKKPYYNYYQYLSWRTRSSYTEAEINKYLTNTMGLTQKIKQFVAGSNGLHNKANESMLYGEAQAFKNVEANYGVNAISTLSLAKNESGNGRSYLSFLKNNLFGHNAVDSNPSNATYYESVEEGINVHAQYYVGPYLDPNDWRYYGSALGDKSIGMNVWYASDPYWGEKAASYYEAIDKALGGKDKNLYQIGIKEKSGSVTVYKEANSTSSVLYQTRATAQKQSFVILGESGDYYRVQTDIALKDDRSGIASKSSKYNFDRDYGYILKSEVNYVSTKGQVNHYLKGDVNLDNYISSKDYNAIKNHITGNKTLSGVSLQIADVNGDGYVSSKDYNAIKNHITGAKPLF